MTCTIFILTPNIEKAKKCTFLKVYDDLFNQHSGIEHKTVKIKELKSCLIGRGTILGDSESPNYERFIPKKEFIKADNRFSPLGIEWLYLAIGSEDDIHECTQKECRAECGQRFGFCHFEFDSSKDDLKLVDLTIADDISYTKLNSQLEDFVQSELKKGIKLEKKLGFAPKYAVNRERFEQLFTVWVAYTYTKLLSEQIFVSLDDTEDKSVMYAPFQTMAQYYISLGYSGIVFCSTVCNVGKNIVLFDKTIAKPVGVIEHYIL
ncbi:MAG TPA: RES domain-containing protein [Candidatus Merdenecus merdavium]|nr:RES domain-containing protein [Candidatus Merdenecus merdavium]